MRVYEIFTSIDGEVNFRCQGGLATFVRLSGCNLSCEWCDVPEAQDPTSGGEMDTEAVANTIIELECPNVTITGGEPLLQAVEVSDLVSRLPDYTFSIETNGTIPPFQVFSPDIAHVSFVVDYKLPSATPKGKSITSDFSAVYGNLRTQDWIKFVIADIDDYEIARYIVRTFAQTIPVRFAFSPVCIGTPTRYFGMLASTLAKKMLDDKLWNVVLNCQIHKLIDMP